MCGIVGWITTAKTPSADRLKYLEQALVVDTLRGDDSTGVFAVRHRPQKNINNRRPGWAKSTDDGYRFLLTEEYDSLVKNGIGKYRAMVGHNRSATVGNISVKAAHPFQESNITLVHNGTLTTTHELPQSERESNAHNDSHCIAINLAANKVEDVIPMLRGSFALVWHDAHDDSINIIRSPERPFHMTLSQLAGEKTLYFASEGGMLKWLMERLKIKHGPITQPKPHVLMRWVGTGFNIGKPEWREIHPKARAVPLTPSRTKHNGSPAGFVRSSGRQIVSHDVPRPTVRQGDSTPMLELGGQLKEVPTICQEALMDLELEPENLLSFVPKMAVRLGPTTTLGTPRVAVYGYIAAEDRKDLNKIPAVLPGISENYWTSHGRNMWTVNPVAVRYIADGEPQLIGKIQSYLKAEGRYVSVAEYEKRQLTSEINRSLAGVVPIQTSSKASGKGGGTEIPAVITPSGVKRPKTNAEKMVEEIDAAAASSKRIYPGPYGSTRTLLEWITDVKGGCINCGDNIFSPDAYAIDWVNNGQDPLCLSCTMSERKKDNLDQLAQTYLH